MQLPDHTNKPLHHPQPPAQQGRPADGSGFAPPASPVSYGAGAKVAGYTTPPNSDDACKFDLIEAYLSDKSIFPNGPDLPGAPACHLFIQSRVIKDFNLQLPAGGSALVNPSRLNQTLGTAGAGYAVDRAAAVDLAVRLDADGHPTNLILPDTMTLCGPGINGAPAGEVNEALIADWRNRAGGPFVPRVKYPVQPFA